MSGVQCRIHVARCLEFPLESAGPRNQEGAADPEEGDHPASFGGFGAFSAWGIRTMRSGYLFVAVATIGIGRAADCLPGLRRLYRM